MITADILTIETAYMQVVFCSIIKTFSWNRDFRKDGSAFPPLMITPARWASEE